MLLDPWQANSRSSKAVNCQKGDGTDLVSYPSTYFNFWYLDQDVLLYHSLARRWIYVSIQVKVETFTRNKVIHAAEACKKFPVLVQITVGDRVEETNGAGVDIIVLVNITTEGEMSMDDMKHGIMIVVDKVSPKDRLSIVSQLKNNTHRLTELTYMSEIGRAHV